MIDMHDFKLEPPFKLHHLTGGIAMMISNNNLAWLLTPGADHVSIFSVLPKKSVFSVLKPQPGIRVLGRTLYRVFEETADPISLDFITAAVNAKGSCLAHKQFEHWNGVAVSLHRQDRDGEALMVSRLDAQIRLCRSRFERLSIAYRTVLSLIATRHNMWESLSFRSDKYAQHIASEFRSALNELYSLRDALLAVAYRLAYGQTDPFQIKKLRSRVLAGSTPFDSLVRQSMFADQGCGLIEKMSLYRSLALHCLGATNPVCGDVYKIACSAGPYGDLRYILFPLYDNVEHMRAVEQGSSKGLLENPTHEDTLRFFKLEKHEDALEFTFDCFRELLLMCEKLADQVQIAPEEITITDADIIEGTFTDETRKQTRFRKNAEGKLKDY